MASSMPATNAPSTRIQWQWNSSEDLLSMSQSAGWNRYSDVENIIIEEAFTNNEGHAMLDDYHIDFQRNMQISNNDKNKQRHVRRFECNSDDNHLREERFTFTPVDPKRPFGGMYGWISPFVKEVAKDLNIEPEQLPSVDETTVSVIVEKAARGIVEEAKLLGKQREGEQLAKMLLEKKEAGMKEVWECCAHLYSLESFLYKRLNGTMRLIGSEDHEQVWRSKVRTLGPFCLLLWDNPSNYKPVKRKTLLYRGANLTEELVSSFKKDCSEEKKPIRSFPSFTSCSRVRTEAERFGNVLFIMEIKHAFTIDLKPYSEYPYEEEELLSPGVCFMVKGVDSETQKNKHLIYLELVQQHRRK